MNTICLIGKPNTGKSTLFNRLIKEKKSIILDEEGITRDRIYGKSTFNNKTFYLIDTGGIDISKKSFTEQIKIQALIAVEEADVIIFVLDGLVDINENDKTIARMLKKSNKKVILAVNKIDNDKRKENLYNFYELGFSDIFTISATHNIGINELLEEATKDFTVNETLPKDDSIRFSLIGRPNVGKSSITNAILNEERAIVSDVPGTTRDSIDTVFKYDKKDYVVIDTAGMRKRGKIYENVEKYSLLRAMKSIERSDVCVIVTNAEEGIIEHDKHIASYALDAGKPMVLVVNKWDLSEEDIKSYTQKMRAEFQFLSYVPIVFLSAKTGNRVHTLMPEIIKVYNNSRQEIKTSLINNVIRDAYDLNPAPSYKGRKLKIYYVTQVGISPIRFNLYVNDKGLVHFSYKRYLENKIRENFDLEGTPIVLQFKNKGEQEL